MGYARSLGITSRVKAELWALKDGLTLDTQLRISGFSSIFVELDVELIVLLLNNYSINNLMLEPLLNDCRALLKKFHRSSIQHIFREATNVLMCWLNLEPPNLFTMLILLTHQMWWRTCWLLIRPSFSVIDLFIVNIISMLVYQKQNTLKKIQK